MPPFVTRRKLFPLIAIVTNPVISPSWPLGLDLGLSEALRAWLLRAELFTWHALVISYTQLRCKVILTGLGICMWSGDGVRVHMYMARAVQFPNTYVYRYTHARACILIIIISYNYIYEIFATSTQFIIMIQRYS
jgi:hypothetical protein